MQSNRNYKIQTFTFPYNHYCLFLVLCSFPEHVISHPYRRRQHTNYSLSVVYVEAKTHITRVIIRLISFLKASVEFVNDPDHVSKRAKLANMLRELHKLRQNVEEDLQKMETAVCQGTAPTDVTDTTASQALAEKFDSIFYELAAFADIHKMSMSPPLNTTTINQSTCSNNVSGFQLPKRKFPIFSGNPTEWQGFEDLFNSILSHVPELPEVECFEYLKTSLQGEALSLIAHLPLTAANYASAWEILKFRYGNKRDLARIHLDALLTSHAVKATDSKSVKKLIKSILENTAALDNLDFITRQWSPILVHIFEKHLNYDLRARWELAIGENQNPSTSEFVKFLQQHLRSASINSPPSRLQQSSNIQKSSKGSHQFNSPRVMTTSISNDPCPVCQQIHSTRSCPTFKKKFSFYTIYTSYIKILIILFTYIYRQ